MRYMYHPELRAAITSRWAQRNVRRALRKLHGTKMPYARSLSDLETLLYGYVGEQTREHVSRRAGTIRAAILFAPVWMSLVGLCVAVITRSSADTAVSAGVLGAIFGVIFTAAWLEGTAREALERWVVVTSDPQGKVSAHELLEPFGGIGALSLSMLDDAKSSRYKAWSIESALVWWWSQLSEEQRIVISSQGRTSDNTIGDVLEAFERCRS